MKPARYDLDFFDGTDEAVAFELVTAEQLALDLGGAALTVRILDGSEEIAAVDLTAGEEDGATVARWDIGRDTTADLARRQQRARRLSYRLDAEGGGKRRTFAYGAINTASPAMARGRLREVAARDGAASVRLTVTSE